MDKLYFNENIEKILLISSLILTIISLLLLNNHLPITNYEVSIYSSTPLFWSLIILSNIILILCIILQAKNKKYELFWISLLILFLNNFIVLSQPLMRGYWGYGSSDPWSHYDKTKSLISYGIIGSDFYPVTHILLCGLNQITFVNIEDVMKFLTSVFSLIFIIFSYLLSKEVFKSRQYSLIVVAICSCFLMTYYQTSIYPQGLAIMILPLIFYLFFKANMQNNNNFSYNILLILLLFLIPFFHPYVSISLVACLISAELIKYLLYKKSTTLKIKFTYTTISIVLFFTWWSSFVIFQRSIEKLNSWFFSEVKAVPRVNEVNFTSHMTPLEIISLFLKTYGDILIYFIIASIAVFLIIWGYKRGNKSLNRLIIISGLFIASIVNYFVIFYTLGTTSFGRLLGSNTAIWAFPLLAAYPLFLIIKRTKKQNLAILIVFLIISSSFTLSAIGLYRSPWIEQPNWHVTYHDFSAVSWQSDNNFSIDNTKIINIGMPVSGTLKPKNFNYSNHSSLAFFYPQGGLLVYGKYRQKIIIENSELNERSLLFPWADPDFTQETANKLQHDLNLENVYSNGDIDIYYVKSYYVNE